MAQFSSLERFVGRCGAGARTRILAVAHVRLMIFIRPLGRPLGCDCLQGMPGFLLIAVSTIGRAPFLGVWFSIRQNAGLTLVHEFLYLLIRRNLQSAALDYA
mmetsp:Transcript_19050/g.76514  ORF Transcript_19050/g.76514 Transcript_19050/m.76514 type:complete len:102 (-) Transcript_19050:146-451(-)